MDYVASLKEELEELEERIRDIKSFINLFEKRTADGYEIFIGQTYYYENAAGKRNPIIFDESARYCDEVIWVQRSKHESGGYYYRNLYKFKGA